jgi:hypothetical protein
MSTDNTDCGCCSGLEADTPAAKFNRAGLPAIAYRVGTHADFKQTLLARLSSTDYPALAPLTTRAPDDYTIALCDSFAVLADVLSFYQERIANESYLGTAAERRSVLMLARLIGYQLAPGVAAGTALAFTLESAPGLPALAAQPVTIPVGTRAQSIPDPNQDPQTFETIAPAAARVEWNAIPAQRSERVIIRKDLTELYIAGTTTQLTAGDAILVVGIDREQHPTSKLWDVRWINYVEVDLVHDLTHISLSGPLNGAWDSSDPGKQGIKVHAFRQRAALFGHNAPDPNLIHNASNAAIFGNLIPPNVVWPSFVLDPNGKTIDLDASYPKIVAGSWFALADGSAAPGNPLVRPYLVDAVTQTSRTAYGLSGKITRLSSDGHEGLDKFELRKTQVLAQSEELKLVERPLTYPLYGDTLALDELQPHLAPDQLIAVSGKRQRVVIGADTTGITFPGAAARTPQPGEPFVMRTPPTPATGGLEPVAPQALDPTAPAQDLLWHLVDRDGAAVDIKAPLNALRLQPALKDDAIVSEVCAIAHGTLAVKHDRDRTTLKLRAALSYCYDRATVAINANVAPATNGETVGELAGSGNAAVANQSFQLKQAPLTYVSSASTTCCGTKCRRFTAAAGWSASTRFVRTTTANPRSSSGTQGKARACRADRTMCGSPIARASAAAAICAPGRSRCC